MPMEPISDEEAMEVAARLAANIARNTTEPRTIQQSAPAFEPGCYVDGHWGQYGIARMVEIAEEMGYDQDPYLIHLAHAHLAECAHPGQEYMTDAARERLFDSADEVEAWMNEHAAADGYVWEWVDGEFFYSELENEEDGE